MSWLLFLDESGHDHKQTHYEVRGGVALFDRKLWPFVKAVKLLEQDCFGALLSEYRTEVKGARLLEKQRFVWAQQEREMGDEDRRALCRGFLTKGLEKKPPTTHEFAAYGQASLRMAKGLFRLLEEHQAELFAAAIPAGVQKPSTFEAEEYLRKDQVFLLERYFYFLEEKNDNGLLVMDETSKEQDRRFVRQMERYFTGTQAGRSRTARIIPVPFFVSSDMTYAVQAADVCIYCVNWGFRLPKQGMAAPARQEIVDAFGEPLFRLQFQGEGYRDGQVFRSQGIVYVPNPYGPGR